MGVVNPFNPTYLNTNNSVSNNSKKNNEKFQMAYMNDKPDMVVLSKSQQPQKTHKKRNILKNLLLLGGGAALVLNRKPIAQKMKSTWTNFVKKTVNTAVAQANTETNKAAIKTITDSAGKSMANSVLGELKKPENINTMGDVIAKTVKTDQVKTAANELAQGAGKKAADAAIGAATTPENVSTFQTMLKNVLKGVSFKDWWYGR